MEWDRDITERLEAMTIFQRERIRERIVEYVQAEGRDRATLDDLTAVRRGARMGAMPGRGMGGRGMPGRGGTGDGPPPGMGGMGGAPQEPLPSYDWPVLAGAYEVIDREAPVAVCTLASETLATDLGRPQGVNVIGRAFTENLGVEKVAINVVANAAIRTLLLCGTESRHHVGQTLVALHEAGLDDDGRVIGSEGPLPLLRNFPAEAQALFREKVTIVDLIGESDVAVVHAAIAEAAAADSAPWATTWRPQATEQTADGDSAPAMSRPEDPAGFVLVSIGPLRDRIVLEHYSNDAELLHVMSGRTANDVCRLAVAAGAVSDLSHATYIGREALKAELAIRHELAYEQDRALELS